MTIYVEITNKARTRTHRLLARPDDPEGHATVREWCERATEGPPKKVWDALQALEKTDKKLYERYTNLFADWFIRKTRATIRIVQDRTPPDGNTRRLW